MIALKFCFTFYSFIICMVFANSIAVSACTCVGEASVRQEFSWTSFVGICVFLSSEEFTMNLGKEGKFKLTRTKYKFLVKQRFKDKYFNLQDTVYVYQSGGNCDVQFLTGKTYLLYASLAEEPNSIMFKSPFPSTDVCTRTKPLDFTNPDLLNELCLLKSLSMIKKRKKRI